MRADLRSRVSLVALAMPLLACATVGCGGGDEYVPPTGVVVNGKVNNGGEPMRVERPDIGLGSIQLILVPDGVDPESDSVDLESTIADIDGTFTFIGPGNGVPAGKYRLAVYHREDGPDVDKLNGACSTINSRIEITVSEENLGGEQDLGVIDVKEYIDKAGTPPGDAGTQ